MTIRWSPEAAADFAGIIDYIHPTESLSRRSNWPSMYDSVNSLESFPNRGRPGRIDGTRELVLAPLPFIIVHRVTREAVEVVRALHGA